MRNRLKEILRQGKVALGATVSVGHPFITDVLGKIGFDFINFDTQHTPLDIEIVQSMMESMSYSDVTPIVRVEWNDFAPINRALDAGAHGIIVPMVNTKEDALKALQYASFAPEGMRSYGPLRASLRDADYFATANKEILVLPQIETKEALDNIESILSVDRIEAFFVGPYDLSMSLGVFTQWKHPVFEKAIDKILCVSEKTGKVPGMLAPIEEASKTIERGFKLLNIGRDTAFLAEAASSALQKARATKP